MNVFDKKIYQLRVNKLPEKNLNFNFLREEICTRNIERLEELKDNFKLGLEIGSSLGELYKCLNQSSVSKKIEKLIQTDPSINLLKNNPYENKIVSDEEELPFKDNSFDIVISNFSLHRVNDPKKVLKKVYNMLKVDRPFIISIPLRGTLENLLHILYEVELKLLGKASPRIHPFTTMEVISNLIHATGFKQITADRDKIEIMYKDFYTIFKDLRSLAETNILTHRDKSYVGKQFFSETHKLFETKHKDMNTNHYPINIEFANIIAWKA